VTPNTLNPNQTKVTRPNHSKSYHFIKPSNQLTQLLGNRKEKKESGNCGVEALLRLNDEAEILNLVQVAVPLVTHVAEFGVHV